MGTIDSSSLILKAKKYSDKLHAKQKRDNGESYTVHTHTVVKILKLVTEDPDILAAGYLHDTIENCGISREQLAKEFNERIATLVWEVTKTGKNCFPNLKSRSAFLIKFADRTHNLSEMDGEEWTEKRKQEYMDKSVFWDTD